MACCIRPSVDDRRVSDRRTSTNWEYLRSHKYRILGGLVTSALAVVSDYYLPTGPVRLTLVAALSVLGGWALFRDADEGREVHERIDAVVSDVISEEERVELAAC